MGMINLDRTVGLCFSRVKSGDGRRHQCSHFAVYRDTIDALYRDVARHAGDDRGFAEDVVQETWLRAARDWWRTGPPDEHWAG
jgi:DNA-directed RNA polymerase specialized sigma24 family protein